MSLVRLFHIIIGILLYAHTSFAQIDPERIQIARDAWGVPHIFAPSDAEVAYGLAWANAEDDFASVQEHLLAAKGRLAEVKGKEGAVMDVIMHLIGLQELVDTAYHEGAFSADFQKVLRGYTQGLNAYASSHRKEVALKDLFPITEKDLVKSYTLGFCLFTGMPKELEKIFEGRIQQEEAQLEYGSNGIAVSRRKTTDGKTYLAINSHQPLEGPFSWYEAHLCSEEGWNILGGTLPGFLSIGHGVNPYLGWAHTVNRPDFTDVYKLKMHPSDPLRYEWEGEWLTLEERPVKIKVKVGPFKFGKKFTFYWSKYGATLEKDGHYYSLRFPANMSIRAPEQQYRMNKARNFEEFQAALDMQALPCFNIVYADREDNIYYLSNGIIPYRDPQYQWDQVLPGNTQATLWEARYHPRAELPQVSNPQAGYVYNTNNTPFHATAPEDNPQAKNYDPTMGYLLGDNNRSHRFQALMEQEDKISYEDFKRIKYDLTYPKPIVFPFAQNIEEVFNLNVEKYPDLSEILKQLQTWDRKNNVESRGAGVFMLFLKYLGEQLKEEGRLEQANQLEEQEMITALRAVDKHLRKYFGKKNVPLGDIQRHVRGNQNLPMAGSRDVLAAMYAQEYKKGRFKTYQGESYIELVRFGAEGPEIETINAYGAANRAKSPHYTDQMEYYTQQKLKGMTLNKEQVLKKAKKVYHPREY